MLAAFSSPWDHPRSCGAHPPAAINITGNSGSSPRMRGSLVALIRRRFCTGIISAHAGLTAVPCACRRLHKDHPRACGAHIPLRIAIRDIAGSSPRMRGSHLQGLFTIRHVGIIPAHAGLTPFTESDLPKLRDHPRVCGAHSCLLRSSFLASGSSPRMRGSPGALPTLRCPEGIIPAYAGLTDCRSAEYRQRRDHSRVCGAHEISRIASDPQEGSSPRMRGSRNLVRFRLHGVGIIPAYAGLTRKSRASQTSSRDHPRVCGAHVGLLELEAPVQGSSPRMRASHFLKMVFPIR